MKKKIETPGFEWQVPKELGIPPDPLRLRLDFHHQSTVMTIFEDDVVTTHQVDALDVARALASDLNFSTGILPENALWWQSTRSGPMFAVYVAPKTWRLTLKLSNKKLPDRYDVPLPGLVFLCSPGKAPWVFAVKKKPTKESDIVYKAPLANVFANGKSCPGTNDYPADIGSIVQSFFISFFSATADLHNRSQKFPDNILKLWKYLHGKKAFPLNDLVPHGTVEDLMNMLTD